MDKITPCLWFDSEGEEAAGFYTSIFPNSRIMDVSHYGEEAMLKMKKIQIDELEQAAAAA